MARTRSTRRRRSPRARRSWRRSAHSRDIDGHPPDIDIRPDGVTVGCSPPPTTGMARPGEISALARRISAVARRSRVDRPAAEVQSMLIVIGARDPAQVMPFWQAAFDYIAGPTARTRTSSIRAAAVRRSGSRRSITRARRVAGSTSRCGCRRRSPRRGSRLPSRRAGASSVTRRRLRGGPWRTVEGNEIDVSTVLNRE